MNETTLAIQSLELKFSQFIIALSENERRKEEAIKFRDLPEFLTLEQAVNLKGGAAVATYATKYWLQPCCGLESKRVGGRKVWRKDLVLEWIEITDDMLFEYGKKFGITIPDKYKEAR
jgi:hypothetical protein